MPDITAWLHRHREQSTRIRCGLGPRLGRQRPHQSRTDRERRDHRKARRTLQLNGIAIATGEDAQVTQAFDLDVVDTAANVQAAAEAAAAAMAASSSE